MNVTSIFVNNIGISNVKLSYYMTAMEYHNYLNGHVLGGILVKFITTIGTIGFSVSMVNGVAKTTLNNVKICEWCS